MAWRVCRVLDFEKHCTSIHSTEDVAKVETAGQLAALITRLEQDLPKYAGVWNYPRVFPGFVEDLEQMIQAVGGLLQENMVWEAYDEWHRFMNRWDQVLAVPLWVQVGTVIVDGPGPTVESSYHPMAGIKKHPQMNKVMDVTWELRKAFYLLYKAISENIFNALGAEGREQPPLGDIRKIVELLASQIDIGPFKSQEHVDHWSKLVWEESYRHFGLSS